MLADCKMIASREELIISDVSKILDVINIVDIDND